MISKKRLQELIEQGATIWGVNFCNKDIEKLELNSNLDAINAGEFMKYDIKHYYYFHYSFESLFETEEDARWELEMTATRTETLNLPTWEEFNKDNFGVRFYNKSREFCLHKVRYSIDDENPLWKIDLYESYSDDEDTVAWEKSYDLTKENYIEACKLCLRLFKGEEV